MTENKPDTPDSDDSHLAFDLLNADDPGGRNGTTPTLRLRGLRGISLSFDGDSNSSLRGSGSRGGGGERVGRPAPRIGQPLLRAIYQELSQLAAEADGVSEKVKVRVW